MTGQGTPTMRGEYCEFTFPDGSRCVFGAHHTVRYHHSETGRDCPVEVEVEWNPTGDIWRRGVVLSDYGDDLLIRLDDGERLRVFTRHTRPVSKQGG